MAGKITDYPTMTTLASGDLLDVSDYDGVSAFVSKSIDWDILKTNIESQITFTNLYTADGTLAGNRIVSMGVNDLTFGSTGDANLLRFDSTSDRIGIGTSTPTEKLEVVGNIFVQQSNYVHTSLTIQSKIANNRGNIIELTESGGVNLNNYNNQLGAGVGTQDLNANFVHYNFKSANHAGATADDVSHLWFDLNLNNAAPTTRMGINGVNSSIRTVLEMRLDQIGALSTSAQPIVCDIVDDWGAHSVDMAGGTYIKTGYKSSLTGVFETSTTGSGIVRSFWADAQGGDVNQAFYALNGDVIVENGNVGIGTSTPTEKLEVVGNAKFSGTTYLNASSVVGQTDNGELSVGSGGNLGFVKKAGANGVLAVGSNDNFVIQKSTNGNLIGTTAASTFTDIYHQENDALIRVGRNSIAFRVDDDNGSIAPSDTTEQFQINTFAATSITVDTLGRTTLGGATADAEVVLNTDDSTAVAAGLKVKNITGVQILALSVPSNGMIVYATATSGAISSVGFWGYEAGAWVKL